MRKSATLQRDLLKKFSAQEIRRMQGTKSNAAWDNQRDIKSKLRLSLASSA